MEIELDLSLLSILNPELGDECLNGIVHKLLRPSIADIKMENAIIER